MVTFKTVALGWGLTLLCNQLYAQDSLSIQSSLNTDELICLTEADTDSTSFTREVPIDSAAIWSRNLPGQPIFNHTIYQGPSLLTHPEYSIDLKLNNGKSDFFLGNRRNRYSALWAFTSLNYLYADLVGLMDKNILKQYQNGVVDGTKITPGFLTVAAGFMQVPLANVFLPQVIKNEKTLRWVQIASGTLMTLVQSGTLFMGKPTPYYALFSTIEIGTTAYITLDAIKWKPKKK